MTPRADRPLEGRHVLLARAPERGRDLAALLTGLGARVQIRATIVQRTPRDLQSVRRALEELERFDWFLFTSRRGVRAFFEQLRDRRIAPNRTASWAAIGPGTAGEIAGHGVDVDLIATQSHSEGFARELESRVGQGQRALLVRPEVARDVIGDSLRQRGVLVDEIAFYRMEQAPGAEQIARDVADGRFDIVIFSSPSTVQYLVQAGESAGVGVRGALRSCAIVAFGPSTAAALQRLQLSPSRVADRPTDEGIVAATCALATP